MNSDIIQALQSCKNTYFTIYGTLITLVKAVQLGVCIVNVARCLPVFMS